MSKKITILLLFALIKTSLAQTITVDNSTNTPAQLVDILLGNSCVTVSNISISSANSIGYFNRNGSAFPINDGLIIRNGNAAFTAGPYTGNNLSSQENASGDTFLQNLSNSAGQTAAITDVAFLEFDFTPLSSNFSFDFLFASNEYGEFQCGFSDVFAFVLTDLNTNVSTNLAVIPGTSTPVTVKDIRNQLYNFPGQNCLSANPNFFGVYNVGNPASTLNMRGHTIVMNASSAVIPNNPYKIRLVIGDYNDFRYDSAVFLAAGSFTTTLDLGPDTVICSGDQAVLNTNLDNTFTYTWYQNGSIIGGATSSTYTVTSPGTYTVEAVKGTCTITDTIVFNPLSVNAPINLQTCNTGAASYVFNLTSNNEGYLGINTTIYDVYYYQSQADILANNPINNPSAYNSVGSETIFIKIFNTLTGNFCDAEYTFDLLVNNAVTATQPNNVSICQILGGGANFDLTTLNSQVLNGLNVANYTVSYYNSLLEAQSGSNPISSAVFAPGTTPGTFTYYIRIQDNSNSTCFDTTTVAITLYPLPIVDDITDPVECSQFVVPVLTNGSVYSGPNGTGTHYNAGDIIDLSGTYYIWVGPDVNGCFNQETFNVYLIDEYEPALNNCGTFTIPAPPFNIGAFYTAPGGPNGTGALILQGTTFTNSGNSSITQDIYYYAEVNGVFCRDQLFTIYIHPVPLLDDPADVTLCDSYILPPLTNGQYFASSGGVGIPLNAGDVISVNGPNFPGTYYVYNQIGHTDSFGNPGLCSLENPFVINLVDTTQFTTVTACSNVGYTLPSISFGGYFTAPMGGGIPVDPTIPITTSQIVYYYTNTSVLPNCTDNLNYSIQINQAPLVDSIQSGTYCGEFVLPVLDNGQYFTLSGGPTVLGQTQLLPGQIIDLSGVNLSPGTYYIYNGPDANNCVSENSFTINLNPFPPVDGVLDRFECTPYSIPTPTNGQIYTAPGGPSGGGTLVNSSQVFNLTQTFYIYNLDTATNCARDLPFTITYSGINLPDYTNVSVCESENYTLPTLTHVAPTPENFSIGYFYDQAGTMPVPNGVVFNIPNTTTTIWVVSQNGDRITCSASDSFDIIVSETPNLNALNLIFDTDECGTYTLPNLPVVAYNIGYFSQPNGVGPILNLSIVNDTDLTGNPQPQQFTYYVYASATNNSNCHDEQAFTFTVYPLLTIDFPDGIICIDPTTNEVLQAYTINTGLDASQYLVEYYLNNQLMGSGSSYIATQAGTYTLHISKLQPTSGANCNYRDVEVDVFQSGPALATFTVSQEFDSNTFITVNITGGFGQYLYQLEYPNGELSALQSSNTFEGIPTGEYYVNIFDNFGNCSQTRIGPIYIINYPNYFTPNNDGVNDYWNIFDISYQNASISIFDRQGKFLKQIYTIDEGWDGTYNGKQLPSTDYWFVLKYKTQSGEVKEFKSHFTLKR